METYISANMGRAEPGPNAKINCRFSHRHIFGHFLVFQSSFKLHFSLPNFIPAIYALHAGYLFETDTLSTPTISEAPSVECQDLLIPTRSNAYLPKY